MFEASLYSVNMIDNYSETTRALYEYILAKAPKGAERSLASIKAELDRDPAVFLGSMYLDFMPTNDTGANLHVMIGRVPTLAGRGLESDSEGNLWGTFKVSCKVSWPSWGEGGLEISQRRVNVMNDVIDFARGIEMTFHESFHQLMCTKTELDKRALETLKNQAIDAISDIVRSNCNGMKVGEEKIMPIPGADYTMLEDFDVERWANGRRFKYRASATSREGFSFVRVA